MNAIRPETGVWQRRADHVARALEFLLLLFALFLANDPHGLRTLELLQWLDPELEGAGAFHWMTAWSMLGEYPVTSLGLACTFLLGLLGGGLLNVVATRTPLREAALLRARAWTELEYPEAAAKELEQAPPDYRTGRSRCIHCGEPIPLRFALPVAGWLHLRGRTACCGRTIPLRYPIVEILTAILFTVMAWRFGHDPLLPAFFVFCAVLVVLAVTDIEHLVLPDVLVLPLLWCGLAVNLQGAIVPPGQAIAGAIAGFLIFRFCRWGHALATGRIGLGLGDCKLAAAIGAWCGAAGLVEVAVLGAGAAFLAQGLLILIGRGGLERRTPLGPWLAGAAIFRLLFPDTVFSFFSFLRTGLISLVS